MNKKVKVKHGHEVTDGDLVGFMSGKDQKLAHVERVTIDKEGPILIVRPFNKSGCPAATTLELRALQTVVKVQHD